MKIVDGNGRIVNKAEVGQVLYAEISVKNKAQNFSFAVDSPTGKSRLFIINKKLHFEIELSCLFIVEKIKFTLTLLVSTAIFRFFHKK